MLHSPLSLSSNKHHRSSSHSHFSSSSLSSSSSSPSSSSLFSSLSSFFSSLLPSAPDRVLILSLDPSCSSTLFSLSFLRLKGFRYRSLDGRAVYSSPLSTNITFIYYRVWDVMTQSKGGGIGGGGAGRGTGREGLSMSHRTSLSTRRRLSSFSPSLKTPLQEDIDTCTSIIVLVDEDRVGEELRRFIGDILRRKKGKRLPILILMKRSASAFSSSSSSSFIPSSLFGPSFFGVPAATFSGKHLYSSPSSIQSLPSSPCELFLCSSTSKSPFEDAFQWLSQFFNRSVNRSLFLSLPTFKVLDETLQEACEKQIFPKDVSIIIYSYLTVFSWKE